MFSLTMMIYTTLTLMKNLIESAEASLSVVVIVCIDKLSPPINMNFTFEYGGRELFEIKRLESGGVVPIILPPPLKTLTTGSDVPASPLVLIYRSSKIQFCPSGTIKRVTVDNSGESVIFTLSIVPLVSEAPTVAVLINITLSGALVVILCYYS